MFSFLMSVYIIVELLGHMERARLTFGGAAKAFPKVAVPFYIPPAK
jgi:hypothetical protein